MIEQKVKLVKKSDKSYRVERPVQTGFSSPATHYNEPRIDLNETLVTNSSATFFIRVTDDLFHEFNIFRNDVLIVDKSLSPKTNQLVLATVDDTFSVIRIDKNDSELNLWGVITFVIKSVL
ncbi:peptidase S24 [Zobellia amurskyensis]|uniref:Peptidase S24 n=1 Tax=Zobellia amurskyensis TaxID=248905 RepID=A0A7X2ZX71_9FLAO|nr:S24 family peptidase [Zobellia amurskyensis]MUH38067.1 peptidase S24 [Zobellia amurskyensis]